MFSIGFVFCFVLFCFVLFCFVLFGFVYVFCIGFVFGLVGNHFVPTIGSITTVSEELHCLVENTVFINIITLICSVLFCETLLSIWNNRFI